MFKQGYGYVWKRNDKKENQNGQISFIGEIFFLFTDDLGWNIKESIKAS